MSKWHWGWILAIVAAVGAWSAQAQQPAPSAYSLTGGRNDLITYCVPAEGRPTALTVIDPATRRIAVYYLKPESGEIQLKSVRNIAGDLSLEYFNSGSPTPDEISKMQRRSQ